ncbi:cytochrome b6-f complex subunit PetL [Leptothoe spongobia]
MLYPGRYRATVCDKPSVNVFQLRYKAFFVLIKRSLVMAGAVVYLVLLFGAAGAGLGMYYGLKSAKII